MDRKNRIPVTDSGGEETAYGIADEILTVLKDLSDYKRKQQSGKKIDTSIFRSESFRNMLSDTVKMVSQDTTDENSLKELYSALLERLTERMPDRLKDSLHDLKEEFRTGQITPGSHHDSIDFLITVIKNYIDSIMRRNSDLEALIHHTSEYLGETEVHIARNLSSLQHTFGDTITANKVLSESNISIIKSIDASGDVNAIRMAVTSAINNINRSMEIKRDYYTRRLNEAEKTMGEMARSINEMKREADELRRKTQEFELDSVHDNLTGLYNRRAYDQKIVETLAHLNRYNVPSSLMICDIDHFKRINDTYGHKVGDLALIKLGALLKERLRINDFISRYGGEEFAIILPHTDLNGAIRAGEGLRSYINKYTFSHNNVNIPLSISVGISAFKKEDDISKVFERADTALYLAKRSGRNALKTEMDIDIHACPRSSS